MKKTLSTLLALLLALAMCCSAAADGEGSSFSDYKPRALAEGETLRRGIDVSQFQGKIDWAAVAESGVDFAFIRAGLRGWGAEGRMLADTRYQENLAEAHKNGILVGAYIYSQAITPAEAREEARYLVELVKDYDIDLPLVFDQEFTDRDGGFYGRLYEAQLSRQEMTDIANAFCAEIERMGYQSLVYSNPYMLSTYLYREQLGQLWLANHVPETQYAGSYEFWQCCAIGRVPGIEGNVDLDFWFASDTAPQPVMRFSDVPPTHWAYRDLRIAVSNGWIKGYPDNTFHPSDTLSRADFVTMLARLSGETLPAVTEAVFPDVPTNKYYAESVAWAVGSGIVSGFPDGDFHPTENVTREQMAHIMRLYLQHKGTDVSGVDTTVDALIADIANVGSWARDDVRFCYAEGLLQGRNEGFVPAGTATRAEAGTVLTRLFRYEHGESPISEPVTPEPEPPITPEPDPGYGVVLSIPEIHIGR
ncbi:MAG: S-layer homology domain-containing protein [Oscillospiraceae bacterium]|nr:S-layer homology domain-containing protein [Oscillospiraceae bacterium]